MKKVTTGKKLTISVIALFSLLLVGSILAQNNNNGFFSNFVAALIKPTPTPQTVRPKQKTKSTEKKGASPENLTGEPERSLSQILASTDFNLIGLNGTVSPANQAVPKNIPTAVLTSIQVPEGEDAAPIIAGLNPNYRIRGELTGPSFTAPRMIETRIGQQLAIPVMPNIGDHVLQNLRIVDVTDSTNSAIAPVTPDSVGITVIDNILVTQVQVTEMTYDQIIQSGINLNDSNYNFYNFTIGLGTSSGTVPIQIPVALPTTGGQLPVVGNPVGGVNVNGVSIPLPDISPVMLEGIDEAGNPTPIEMPGGGQMQIPGVVVFPGRIGLLNQFFEAIVIVANGAPNGTPLVITNLRAKAKLPDAGTPNDATDDPLRIAATQQGGVQSQLEIHGLGADGRYGTADDTVSFNPGQSGQASFLLEGLKEGLHTVDFDLEGTLQGLPSGNVTVRGSVPGAVLVRDAEFGVTFTHPSVVRAGQEYDLGLTVYNSGQRNLNGISLQLRGDSVSGATLIDSETKMLTQTITPGNSGTVKWRLRSNTTGQVTASYIKVGNGIDAGLNLVTGVGDRNVPLSPDSLILPDAVDSLPPDVVEAARQMLGQAWSVATAPAGSLPSGVLPVDKQTVIKKAIELGWAGLRIDFHENRDTALRTLLRDWIGENSANSSSGFADALRNTNAGYYFFDVVGTKFYETVGTESASDFHKKLVLAESSRSAFISAYVSQNSGQQILGAKINSPTNQSIGFGANANERFGDLRTGASVNLLESDPHNSTNNTKGNLLVVSKPATGNWSLEINGWASGNADISILAPTTGKNYRQLNFTNVAVTAGKRYRITFKNSGTTAPIIEEFINGAFRPATLNFTSTDVSDPNPEITGIVQVTDDVIEGGDKYGRLVGVLFSKPMTKASVETLNRYQIGGGQLVSDPSQTVGRLIKPTSSKINFGDRLAILALDSPVGPYIKRTITANGIVDLSGKIISNSTKEIEMRVSPQGNPPGGYLTGRVMQADGTAVPNAGVFYRRMKATNIGGVQGSPCDLLSTWETVSYQKADANGEYTIDYVREGDCHPVTVLFQNPATNSEKTLVSNIGYNGQHLIFNAVFLARGNVQGTVTSGGVPLANANVSILSELDPLNNKLVRTDAQGRYSATSVPVGGLTVKAVGTGAYSLSSGISAGSLNEAGGTVTINVTTQNVSGVIKGKVLDNGNGQSPVQNSLVVAKANIPGFPSTSPIPVGYAFTQADGSFTIDRLPIGNVYLEAIDPNRGIGTSATVQLTPQNTQATGVILLISNGFGRVLGRVFNEIGQAIPNAVVQEGSQAVQADSAGNYVLPQTREGNVSISATDPITRQTGSTTISVRRNEDTSGADIVIRRPANLNGQVFVNQNGTITPVAQAYVSVDGRRIVRTDSQGRYTLNDVQSGTNLTVRFVDPQGRLFVNTDVILNPGETLSRNATFKSAKIHGKITQPDGVTPVVTGVNLTTSRPHLNQDIFFGLPEESNLSYQTTTDGLYSFDNLNTVNYRVSASNVFFPITVSQSGILAANDNLEINLSLVDTLAGKVSGHIYQPDGTTPVGAGVKVSLGGGSLSDVTVRTNASGYYEFAEVFAEGWYTLAAIDPLTNRTNQTGVYVRKNQNIEVDLRLLGRGNLKVKVVDGGGVPLQTGSINVAGSNFPNDQRYIELTAVNNGEFNFTNLTEGTYAISASYNNLGGRASGTVTIGGNTEVTIQVQAVGKVTGRVYMPDGTTPVGLADVTLSQNGRIIGLITTQDSDEERGKFDFSYVPAGDFTIDVFDNRSGRQGRSAGTIVQQNQTANVSVNLLALGTVIGQVTSNGIPAESALVNISADGSGISGTSRVATTDADGRFRFPGIPVGRVYIYVSNGPGGLTGNSQGIVAGTNEPLPDTVINVALTPTANIAGTVYKFGGSERYSGALVKVTSNGFYSNTTTDENGNYRVGFVPLGNVNVKVEAPFGYDRGKSATIVSNQAGATLTADVTMSGVGNINGTATGSNGSPLTFGKVTFTNNAWGENITVVAPVQPNGTYSLQGLPTGEFNLKLTVPEIIGAGTATDNLAGGQTLVKNLQLESAGKVFGNVKATDGTSPAIGSDVILSLAKQGGGSYTFITHTNSTGYWEIDNLPLGTISVRITDANSGGVANISALNLNTNGQQIDTGTVILDNSPITVVSVTPANNAVNVAPNSTVQITFSEPVDASTINSGTVKLNLGALSVNTSQTISTDGATVTLTPSQNLAESQNYSITVTTQVKDRNGIALAQQFTSTFATADQTPPSISAINPPNGSGDILLNSKVTVTANETLDLTQNLSNLIQVSTNNVAVTGTTTLDQTRKILEFTPAANLIESSLYNVTVNGLKDASGNVQTTAFTSNFRTKDVTPPVVNPLPIDGTSVRTFTPTITVTYSDNFSGINVNSIILRVDGTTVPGTTVTGSSLSYSPTAPLSAGNHNVSVQVADNSGNVSQPRTATFTIDNSGPIISTFTIGGVPAVNGVQISSSLTPIFEVNYTDDTGINQPNTKLLIGYNGAVPTQVSATVTNTKLTYQSPTVMPEGNYVVRAIITNNLGTATDTGEISFTIDVDAPDIQTITPNHGNQHGGTSVTLTGLRLLNSNGTAPTVSIGNNPATFLTSTLGANGNPDTVVIVTPAGVPGNNTVEVTTDRGIGRNVTGFVYDADSKTPFSSEPDSLLLWHLDELGNGAKRILDSNYLSVDGTASANSTASEGRFAGGRTKAQINGDNDFGSLNLTGSSFTVESWVKTNPVTRDYFLVGRGSAGCLGHPTCSQFGINLSPSGAIQGKVWNNAQTQWQTEMLPTVYDADNNQWHLVTMVVDETLGQMKLYVDGVERAASNKPANFGAMINAPTYTMQAGVYNYSGSGSGGSEFTGILDDVRVSSTAHSSTKVLNDYLGSEGNTGLKVYYNSLTLVQKNKESIIDLYGYGLAGVSVSVSDLNGNPIQARVISSSSTNARISLSPTNSTALGDTNLNLASPSGTGVFPIRIVDYERNVFSSEPDTRVLWHLDELGNGTARVIDDSAFSIDGTASANSTASEGRFAGGRTKAQINGDNDFGSLNLTGSSFTVESWVKTNPVTRDYFLVGRGSAGCLGHPTCSQFGINLSPSGAIQGKVWNNAQIQWQTEMLPTVYDVDNNQWHLVTMVVDETLGQMKLYVDGVERATSNKPANFGAMINAPSYIMQAGVYNYSGSGSGGSEFTGTLDDVRVSSTAHSAQRIQRDFDGVSELRVTSYSPQEAFRERANPVPVNTQIAVNGYDLENVSGQIIKENQPIDATVVTTASSYRQATLNVSISQTAPIGVAQLVLSKPNQTPVSVDIRIAEKGQFVVDSDTVVLWNLNENQNGAARILDSGLLSIKGTATSSSLAAEGRFAGGRTKAQIYGDNDFGSLNLTGSSFTVESWVKTNPVTRDYFLVGRGSAGCLGHPTCSQFGINLSPSGAIQGKIWNNSQVQWQTEMLPTVYDADNNQWHLVTMVVDETLGQMKLYVDGVERATSSKPANFGAMINAPSYIMQAGVYNYSGSGSGGSEFTGTLDDVRVSSTAHSAQRITLDTFGSNSLRIVRVNPAVAQKGVTSQITVTGYGLNTATITSNNPEVSTSIVSSTLSELVLNVSVSNSSQIGQTILTLTDYLGSSANTPITIVNQQPFVISAQTKLLWNLNEIGNGAVRINDSSVTSTDGTAISGSLAAVGRFAGGRTKAQINGDNDFGSLNLTGSSFTVESWVKTNPVTRDYFLVGRGSAGCLGHPTCSQFGINLSPSGAIQGNVWNNSQTQWQVTLPRRFDPITGYWLAEVTDNQWHLVTMVLDETLGQMKLYVDGVERAASNKPVNFGAMINAPTYTMQAGVYNYSGSGSGGSEFTGILDDVRIVNYARTPQEISDTWLGTTNGFAALAPKSSIPAVGKEIPPKPLPDKRTEKPVQNTVSGDVRRKQDSQKEERR